MRMYDIIKKKRDGYSLTTEEINYFVENYTNGNIPDYQASALLMAIYFNKMDKRETLDLTKAMINSGDTFDLSAINGIKVDKHSTGGVGDSVTLILGPMIAACGVPFVKMSGRGLGHTGGTLDKLEAIRGFRVALNNDEFVNNTNDINISICSQTGNITPADKKLYALRDVTATVENISLIAGSIMSKKLAIKSDAILLDVKVGSGAFMKSIDDAIALAEEMVAIGNSYGRKTIAVVTNMDEPLGRAVGNVLEVKEAIETLQGKGPNDLFELCLVLGSKLLILAGKVKDEIEGRKMLIEVIESGKAYQKLIELVEHQDGDISYVKDIELLPKAKYILEVKSDREGYIKSINAEEVGKAALVLGAGRETIDSKLDLSVGIVLNKKVDDKIKINETLAYIHANDLEKAKDVEKRLKKIFIIGEKNIENKQLVYREINHI
ncbi:pyrimidine-nucleoside phosphorylase [Tissierella praeacuta DSM 18095]|uniref:Pyrimidine-nucleoside phosphorylase n=1 Tax=Tissierella praeacuta DSM 18095 TaxID=1123404 RepID=A0A1M4SEH9_9FIRM|nr:pyrimidine-nucleoside phosphorylase [Tissierella praeacuta]SHE30565.1 pyrimidine-nucleoside phosphorylase [Tissierella praeacuta DSM 18095]SUP01345.1 Pyrimidine-nucleoside phosphorylase [Tissierella praeacuta]